MPLQIAIFRPWMVATIRRVTVFLAVFVATAALLIPDDSLAQQTATTQPTSTTANPTNSVVAVVNAEPITQKALADETLRRYGKETVDSMINRFLILQACKSRGIEITNAEVREEIQRQAAKFKLDLPGYLQVLQENRGVSPDEYSSDIVWPMLALRRLVAEEIEISEEEFNRAYTARYGEAVKCRMIMLSDLTQAKDVQAQAKQEPASFEDLAKKFSEDESSASVGGLIPPIRRFTGDSRLEQAVFGLPEGQVSDVLQMGDQWLILQAVRRMPAATPPPQAMPVIKDQIVDQLRDEKVRMAASGLFQKLQADAQVVKIWGDTQLTQQNPGVAALINGQPLPVSAVAKEAVKRHGDEVLQGEINRKLLTQALAKAGVRVESSDLDAEVRRAAASFGFVRADGSPDLSAWMDQVTSDGMTTQEIYVLDAVWPSVALRKLVSDQTTLTQQELSKGFESAYGPKVEVLAIVLPDQRTAQKIWEMARDNPTDVFFGQLAQQYSVEPVSASNSGKVPPIRKHGGQPAIEKEAFTMKPGELSGIIATGDQYIIMRCQGYTEPIVTDFEAVRSELVSDLTDKKLNKLMADKFDSLKEAADIENFLSIATKNTTRARR